jgi:hypothetical protein
VWEDWEAEHDVPSGKLRVLQKRYLEALTTWHAEYRARVRKDRIAREESAAKGLAVPVATPDSRWELARFGKEDERLAVMYLGPKRHVLEMKYAPGFRRGYGGQLKFETTDPQLFSVVERVNAFCTTNGFENLQDLLSSTMDCLVKTYFEICSVEHNQEVFSILHRQSSGASDLAEDSAGPSLLRSGSVDNSLNKHQSVASAYAEVWGAKGASGISVDALREARRVLRRELRALQGATPKDSPSGTPKFGAEPSPECAAVSATVRDISQLFRWEVDLCFGPEDGDLFHSLQAHKMRFGSSGTVRLELRFRADFPITPPMVRVLGPVFEDFSCPIVHGAIASNWLYRQPGSVGEASADASPDLPCDVVSLLRQIRSMLLRSRALVDLDNPSDYDQDTFSVVHRRFGLSRSAAPQTRNDYCHDLVAWSFTYTQLISGNALRVPDDFHSGNKVLLPSNVPIEAGGGSRVVEVIPRDDTTGLPNITFPCGFHSAIAPKGTVVLPDHLMQSTMLTEGCKVTVRTVELPKISRIVLKPHRHNWAEECPVPVPVFLRTAIQRWSCFSRGEVVRLRVSKGEFLSRKDYAIHRGLKDDWTAVFTIDELAPDVPAAKIWTGFSTDLKYSFSRAMDEPVGSTPAGSSAWSNLRGLAEADAAVPARWEESIKEGELRLRAGENPDMVLCVHLDPGIVLDALAQEAGRSVATVKPPTRAVIEVDSHTVTCHGLYEVLHEWVPHPEFAAGGTSASIFEAAAAAASSAASPVPKTTRCWWLTSRSKDSGEWITVPWDDDSKCIVDVCAVVGDRASLRLSAAPASATTEAAASDAPVNSARLLVAGYLSGFGGGGRNVQDLSLDVESDTSELYTWAALNLRLGTVPFLLKLVSEYGTQGFSVIREQATMLSLGLGPFAFEQGTLIPPSGSTLQGLGIRPGSVVKVEQFLEPLPMCSLTPTEGVSQLDQLWSCSMCTFENEPFTTECEACGNPRESGAEQAVEASRVQEQLQAELTADGHRASVFGPSKELRRRSSSVAEVMEAAGMAASHGHDPLLDGVVLTFFVGGDRFALCKRQEREWLTKLVCDAATTFDDVAELTEEFVIANRHAIML